MIRAVLVSLMVVIICSHTSNAQSSSSCYCDKPPRLEVLQATGVACCDNAVNDLSSLGLSGTPKKIISGISRPVDMVQVGSDVYITARTSGSIYKFDQDGNQLEVISLTPSGIEPKFLEVHNNKMYVGTVKPNRILVSSDIDSGAKLSFSTLLNLGTLNPNEIQFTPDGSQFLLGTVNYRLNVYNSNDLTLEKEIKDVPRKMRDIQFDVFGNVYVSTVTNTIKVYSPEYEFIKDITYSDTQRIDGLMFQCDGSKILVDQAQQILLADREDNIVDRVTIPGLEHPTPLRNILFTTSGSIFVNVHYGDRVLVY